MADPLYHPSPSRRAAIDEKTKIAKLREQRLANDAARRDAGTLDNRVRVSSFPGLHVGVLTASPISYFVRLRYSGGGGRCHATSAIFSGSRANQQSFH